LTQNRKNPEMTVPISHYCGFAVALMLQYWVNNDKPGRIWQEYDLRDLDLKAQNGDFGWPIDVLFNGGFLCTNIGVDNEENWARSKVAASNLFCIHDRLDKLILTTQPVDQEPEVGLSTAWQRIHGYDDSNKNKRLPTIIVTKTGETTLHYMLIVGTEKEGSEEGFWVNDPWLDVENPSYIPRWKLDEDMSIPFGQYGWVGYVMNGKGIFGFLTEHNYWR